MTFGQAPGLDKAIHALMQSVTEKVILERFQNLASDQIIEKSRNELVTIADREAEEMLTEGLSAIDPSLTMIGEEASHTDPSLLDRFSEDCWIVDPIDGTHNFAHGKPPFGILIAQAYGGVCQSGWILDCLSGRFCHAHRGQGAFVNGERVAAHATGIKPPIAAISLIFLSEARRKMILEHIAPFYNLVDIPRCAAEQYPRLALGINDVSLFERTLPWDHAAGELWLNEAGGKAARPDGSSYRVDEWDRPGLIAAANPALWDELAARMEDLED